MLQKNKYIYVLFMLCYAVFIYTSVRLFLRRKELHATFSLFPMHKIGHWDVLLYIVVILKILLSKLSPMMMTYN